jgi:hypothetical protein
MYFCVYALDNEEKNKGQKQKKWVAVKLLGLIQHTKNSAI